MSVNDFDFDFDFRAVNGLVWTALFSVGFLCNALLTAALDIGKLCTYASERIGTSCFVNKTLLLLIESRERAKCTSAARRSTLIAPLLLSTLINLLPQFYVSIQFIINSSHHHVGRREYSHSYV